MSQAHIYHPMAWKDKKWRTIKESGTGTNGHTNWLGNWDWTHPKEATIQHHWPCYVLEFAKQEKEGRNTWRRSRIKCTEQDLARRSKSSPEPYSLKECRWWHEILTERQAYVSKMVWSFEAVTSGFRANPILQWVCLVDQHVNGLGLFSVFHICFPSLCPPFTLWRTNVYFQWHDSRYMYLI